MREIQITQGQARARIELHDSELLVSLTTTPRSGSRGHLQQLRSRPASLVPRPRTEQRRWPAGRLESALEILSGLEASGIEARRLARAQRIELASVLGQGLSPADATRLARACSLDPAGGLQARQRA